MCPSKFILQLFPANIQGHSSICSPSTAVFFCGTSASASDSGIAQHNHKSDTVHILLSCALYICSFKDVDFLYVFITLCSYLWTCMTVSSCTIFITVTVLMNCPIWLNCNDFWIIYLHLHVTVKPLWLANIIFSMKQCWHKSTEIHSWKRLHMGKSLWQQKNLFYFCKLTNG